MTKQSLFSFLASLVALLAALVWFISWGTGWFHAPNEYGIAAAIILALEYQE